LESIIIYAYTPRRYAPGPKAFIPKTRTQIPPVWSGVGPICFLLNFIGPVRTLQRGYAYIMCLIELIFFPNFYENMHYRPPPTVFRPGKGSPMATNDVPVLVVVVLRVIVIRFSIPYNFFISQPIVIKLYTRIGDNIFHSRTVSDFRVVKFINNN